MINPDAIIKTNRRSISITISKMGEVIVHAPKRLSMDKVIAFICEKEQWITKKKKEILDNLEQNKDLLNYNVFSFCGKNFKPHKINGVKKIEIVQNKLLCPDNLDETELLNKILRWYFKTAKLILNERIEYFASLMQLDYSLLTITNSKNRWGSCDSKGHIKLNFRVIMLPHKIIDYIIIHELAHLIELNHSKKFYKIIECVMPDYQKHRKKLKDYSFMLELFR